MRNRAFLALAILAAGAVASAQKTFAVPHILEASGSILGVVFDCDGGQLTHSGHRQGATDDFQLLRTLHMRVGETPEVLQRTKNAMQGITGSKPYTGSIHRYVKGGMGGKFTFEAGPITEVGFPALDSAAKEAGFFDVFMEVQNVRNYVQIDNSPEEKERVKQQKMWLPSNFRVSIGDLPASRVSKVDSFTFKQAVGDYSERPVWTSSNGISMIIPAEDAAPYEEWLRKKMIHFELFTPNESSQMLTIEYQDDNEVPFFTLSVLVNIESVGFADIFGGTTATPGRDVRLSFRAVNNPGVK